MSKTELTVGVNWLGLIFIRKYNHVPIFFHSASFGIFEFMII